MSDAVLKSSQGVCRRILEQHCWKTQEEGSRPFLALRSCDFRGNYVGLAIEVKIIVVLGQGSSGLISLAFNEIKTSTESFSVIIRVVRYPNDGLLIYWECI